MFNFFAIIILVIFVFIIIFFAYHLKKTKYIKGWKKVEKKNDGILSWIEYTDHDGKLYKSFVSFDEGNKGWKKVEEKSDGKLSWTEYTDHNGFVYTIFDMMINPSTNAYLKNSGD